MSAFPDAPDDFIGWWRRHAPDEARADGFAPRTLWGAYLHGLFAETGVTHLRTTVDHLQLLDGGVRLVVADGRDILAGRAVLAFGHASPAPIPSLDPAAVAEGHYVQDVWGDWPREPGRGDPVVLVGSGLTAIDMLLRLRAGGHEGVVTMISRHGHLTQGHGPPEPIPPCAVQLDGEASALAYLRSFRASLAAHPSWRAVIDSLRQDSNALWARLPLSEKRAFRRHLFHLWNTSRHRMAPEIARIVDRDRAEGRLLLRRGHVLSVGLDSGEAVVTVLSGGARDAIRAALVLNCTGPEMDLRRSGNRLARSLFDAGLACPGDLGVAFATAPDGALIDRGGSPSETLFAIGPLRAGTLFETTAIPEIRVQARDIGLSFISAR